MACYDGVLSQHVACFVNKRLTCQLCPWHDYVVACLWPRGLGRGGSK